MSSKAGMAAMVATEPEARLKIAYEEYVCELPRAQHAAELQPQVEVQGRGVVELNDEACHRSARRYLG